MTSVLLQRSATFINATTLAAAFLAAHATTATAARDPLKQPFASDSIWNTPIGSNAVYVPANLPAVPGDFEWAPMPDIDPEKIVLRPMAPSTPIYYSSAGWSGEDRCVATGDVLTSVPVPTDYVVPHNRLNGSAVFLLSDGRTLVHAQPFSRC